jgi:DNA polymerase III sliding clamp (beta) subunit (PCNA family)
VLFRSLKDALNKVKPAVSADYVILRTENDKLIVESLANPPDLYIRTQVDANIAEQEQISIRFSTLHRFLGKSGTITISKPSTTDATIYEQDYIKCETASKPYTSVQLPDLQPIGKQTLTSDHLKILDTVRKFCAGEPSRPILTGVFIHFDGKSEHFVSADGFRLLIAEFENNLPKEASIIIPDNICKLITKMAGDIQMVWDNKTVRFENDSTMISASLIQGAFPNYIELLPKEKPSWTIHCSGADIDNYLEHIDGLIAKLTPQLGKLLVTISSAIHEENFSALIPAKMTGEDKVALSVPFLKDLAKIFDSMTMTITSCNMPVMVTGDNGLKALQMPMFINWAEK